MLKASNIHYEVADRTRAITVGGIGLMHSLARRTGLIERIDQRLELLKVHKPYHESDHVLNIAFNTLVGGKCLEDIELRRNDEAYLDALGAQRIPDPTTAGDFCRRFVDVAHVEALMDAINETRLEVWKQQPESFFEEAIIEADGTIAPTTGECKEGMDMSHKGEWGYHPLVVSLQNTAEPLFLVNRSGNRPSHEGAAIRFDQAIELCRRAGFKKFLLRGDTDFSQTAYLDGWDEQGVRFVFGYDARANLVSEAESLRKAEWQRLERPPKYEVQTEPRTKPENIKERIVEERGYENITLLREDIAEFEYSPSACRKGYRVVALRKKLGIKRGQKLMFNEFRYFFYITNDREMSAEEVVFSANKRCDQENLIGELKNGLKALGMPSDGLLSNWAYTVMASLAWSMKAWFALILPVRGRWKEKHREEKERVLRMGFRGFLNSFIRIPAQIIRGGRRIRYRLLGWNREQHIFLRAADVLNC